MLSRAFIQLKFKRIVLFSSHNYLIFKYTTLNYMSHALIMALTREAKTILKTTSLLFNFSVMYKIE